MKLPKQGKDCGQYRLSTWSNSAGGVVFISNRAAIIALVSIILALATAATSDVVKRDQEVTHVFSVPMLFAPLVEHKPRVIITTSSSDPIDVILSIDAIDFESQTTVSRYSQTTIALPTSVRISNVGVSDKTIVVRSSGNISVHCIDNEFESGDGFLVMSNSQLGNDYYIMSYIPFYHYNDYHPPFLCLSALEEGAVVEITAKTGQKTQIPLKPFESFRYDAGYYDDMTGAYVHSDKPVSVVSGVFTRVPHGASRGADGLLEQIPPVRNWGTSHVLSPFLGRSSGYVYRVLSGNQPATLSISNRDDKIRIEIDQWFEGDVSDQSVIVIDSDRPVLVFQYMKSNQENDAYEPAMMMVPPINSFDNTIITFPVFNCTFVDDFQYNLNVFVKCVYASNLVLDGSTGMGHWQKLQMDDGGMCVLRGSVSVGVHSITHQDPKAKFSVAVYGLHPVSSYAYPAGYKPAISGNSNSSTAVIIGVILAALVVILVIVLAVVVFLRRKHKFTQIVDLTKIVSP